ncbi:hypothetical protein [Oceanicella sp. SM1341]|uniref:hypothetical protein n=1 Tax=Oceanicella sp. SM1341 TaxID=1548889 RepID=UPI000E511829|nr:hypothetical protein [Oceanicella sp. SM1341]
MSGTAAIRAAIAAGDQPRALALLGGLIAEVTGIAPQALAINADRYSLNSVNGFFTDGGARAFFFKFHQEEGEEEGVSEYYNAKVLAEAGYPVTRPVFAETRPGRQILVYERMEVPRLSDLCSAIEKGEAESAEADVIAAQQAADSAFAEIALRHLHDDARAETAAQPLHQLFYNRLVDRPGDVTPGGRVARFYLGAQVRWHGLEAPFDTLATLPWRIDGVDYDTPLAELFATAIARLAPARFTPGPVFPAHGDAHNANVWFHPAAPGAPAHLSLFDPAFANAAVPALLAEVKATFHNIFAHPFWLYEPDVCAARTRATARLEGGRIVVETGHALSPLRRAFLASKAERFWRPLLTGLARRGALAEDWEAQVRMALFACPTLVMNLLPGEGSSHNPTSSLIGFAQAVRAAQAPATPGAEDDFTRFFAAARPR